VNAPLVDMSNRLPAGGYVSTVEDLARFAAAVMSGRLVSRETFQRMVTPGARSSAPPYGLGWGLEPEPWHDDTWIFHGGSSPGASGMLALMPRHAYAVVFLTNLDDLPGRSELAEAITRVVLDFGPPAAK
jgi:CubicO group peptidase (beta-lactamase class C family)